MAERISKLKTVEHLVSASKNRIISSTRLQWRLKFVALLLYSWVFQSYNYVSRIERAWKLCWELGSVTMILVVFWILGIPATPFSILVSLVLGHTIGWIPNNNIVMIFKSIGMTRLSDEDLVEIELMLRAKAEACPAISRIQAFGSISREERSEGSDFDIRVFPNIGWGNGMRSCLFTSKIRMWALSKRFPLDVYVVGDMKELSRQVRDDEKPIDIYVATHKS